MQVQRWRHLPNAISTLRLFCVPVLVLLATTRHELAFGIVLVIALISDIADGAIARRFNLGTELGAMLDSIADFLTLLAAIFGIVMFHRSMLHDHWQVCAVVIGVWAAECVLALLRYGRLSSFHTYASKLTGYVLGFFLCVLFLFGFNPWLFYLAAIVSILGNIEEIVLLWLIPQWRADVRGLWWVLRE
jgi:CDP-diacylglycerol--glycerol-3-phosphate 3-phosphatidyltransferase